MKPSVIRSHSDCYYCATHAYSCVSPAGVLFLPTWAKQPASSRAWLRCDIVHTDAFWILTPSSSGMLTNLVDSHFLTTDWLHFAIHTKQIYFKVFHTSCLHSIKLS